MLLFVSLDCSQRSTAWCRNAGTMMVVMTSGGHSLDLCDVASNFRLYTFSVHGAAIGVLEAMGRKVPNFATFDQGALRSTSINALFGQLLGHLEVSVCSGGELDQ